MANSACPKCAKSSFEIKEATPAKSHYKIWFVQCSNCGTIVGTMPYFDAGLISKDNQEQIKIIQKQLDDIENLISKIIHPLQ